MVSEYLFSYKDVTVHSYDLALLENHNWLNDICISLAFRLLDDSYLTSSIDNTGNLPVLLVDPSVVSFIRIQAEDDEDFEGLATGTGVRSYDWLLLPINDSMDFQSASTHWSLLICHIPTFSLFHCDSCGSSNLASAKHLLPKLMRLLNYSVHKIKPKVYSLHAPRQQNSYDCGVYTILFAKSFLELLQEGGSEMNTQEDIVQMQEKLQNTLQVKITSETALSYRKDLRALIIKQFNL